MTDPSSERRRTARVPMRVEARMRLLLPEETFTPFPLHGHTREVSFSGLRFETTQTTMDLFRLVTRRTRFVRISTLLPGSDHEATLFGRIVWVKFLDQVTPPVCVYGIAFENLGESEEETLQRCLNLVSAETAPGLSGDDVQVDIDPTPGPS